MNPTFNPTNTAEILRNAKISIADFKLAEQEERLHAVQSKTTSKMTAENPAVENEAKKQPIATYVEKFSNLGFDVSDIADDAWPTTKEDWDMLLIEMKKDEAQQLKQEFLQKINDKNEYDATETQNVFGHLVIVDNEKRKMYFVYSVLGRNGDRTCILESVYKGDGIASQMVPVDELTVELQKVGGRFSVEEKSFAFDANAKFT